jgi:hypothetical protein
MMYRKTIIALCLSAFVAGCGLSSPEPVNASTEALTSDKVAAVFTNITMDDLEEAAGTAQFVAETAVNLIRNAQAAIEQTRTDLDFETSGSFECQEAPSPQYDAEKWAGYCWLEVTHLPLGIRPGGLKASTFTGLLGYKDALSAAVQIQVHLKEDLEKVEGSKKQQEIYTNVIADVYGIPVDQQQSGDLGVTIRSPKNVYSYKTSTNTSLLKAFCNWALNEDVLNSENANGATAEELQAYADQARAVFGPLCEKMPESLQDAVDQGHTAFKYIDHMTFGAKKYRGAMLLGRSLSNTDFRNNVALASVQWGNPTAGTDGFERIQKVYLRFKGNYQGMNKSMPEDPTQCYVVQLDGTRAEKAAGNAKVWAESIIAAGAFVAPTPEFSEINLTTETCPLACISDAECAQGELCDLNEDSETKNQCKEGCADNSDCPAQKPTCCDNGELGDLAGSTCKLVCGAQPDGCTEDSECESGKWCQLTTGVCIPGCRDDGGCDDGEVCCKGPNAHACTKTNRCLLND